MKRTNINNTITLLLAIALIMLTRLFESLPWWSSAVPMLLLGMAVTLAGWKVPVFLIGCLAGLVVWTGASFYFDMQLKGVILDKVGMLLSVPKIVVIILSGLVGSLLTGLSAHTGKSIFIQKQINSR